MHYRELTVWRKAMDLARETYRLVPNLPREEMYGMRSQLTRAAISIPANIAEGWTRETEKDRAHFLAMAQGSLSEAETLLTLCEEIGWMPPSETAPLRSLMTEVGKMLSTLRRKLRTKLL
ncbi:MAG TPA: four helix bundle protein [Thermoanaerobaculia bacterium]|nr:four helix bundle protein [Thermoanaerobaculia bacterium]